PCRCRGSTREVSSVFGGRRGTPSTWRWVRSSCQPFSSKQFKDRLTRAGRTGETVAGEPRLGRDPQGVQPRGPEILGRNGSVLGVKPEAVGRPIDEAAPNAAAG